MGAKGLSLAGALSSGALPHLVELFAASNPDLLPWLVYDFRRNERRQGTPQWMGGRQDRSRDNALIQSGRIHELLPETAGLPPRELGRRIMVEELQFEAGTQTMLFYYPLDGKGVRTIRLE